MKVYARKIIRERTTAEKGLPKKLSGLREEVSLISEIRHAD